ncbi:MAG: aldo/keto reductase [Porticoccaceae bacterium]|nr:MAG: aldo/keto reductase [Porticoccaceae bacterium]
MPLALDHYRLLGRSGLRVSPLCLGTMTFGVPPETWGTPDGDAARQLDLFLDRGGNFIDTANFYGNMGGSERLLGRLLAGRRHRVVLATKYSLTMDPTDPNAAGNHRKNLVRSVEKSLERLGTDYIDLLYLHVWDARTPVEEILRGFDDLVRAGKILYAGISDTPVWQVSRMQAIAELRGWTPFVALQIPYSLIERTVEREFLPMAEELGLGVLPWSPLGGGVLTGKYRPEDLERPPEVKEGMPAGRRSLNLAYGRLTPKALEIARVVAEVARELGRSPAQVALAWTLRHPAVVAPIIGARTLAQLEDNLGALEVELAPEHLARLDEVSRVDVCFPQYMFEGETARAVFGGVTVERRRR